MRTQLLVLAALTVAVPGCVVIPVPNARLEGWGVESRVVDGTTLQPIAGAEIVDRDRPGCRVVSDRDGRFRLPPYVQWHFAYLFGAISYPLLPFTQDLVLPARGLVIRANGYKAEEFGVLEGDRHNLAGTRRDGDWFVVPSIRLSRIPATGERPTSPQ